MFFLLSILYLYCTYVKRTDLYPVERRGGIDGNMGCKEQLILDETIHEEVKHHKRNLSEAWIDLRKACDSVYKKWLTEGLNYWTSQRGL